MIIIFKFSLLIIFYPRIAYIYIYIYVCFKIFVTHKNVGVVSVLISLHVGTLTLVLVSIVGF